MSKDEEFKLMYGMLFSIKSFASRLSPTDMKEGFLNFTTSKYKLHFFETPSGLKLILNTDLSVGNMKDVLQQIFSSIYVEYVVKNPLCQLDQPITSELFKYKLDEYVKSLSAFQTSKTAS
ncbi:trafficking protein particle complex subunit 1 [Biomphalaria glabrata]|nr:trafficking protein particle complex subunit 1-like [Biomphalaria glabrata]KAI8770534.1 trafficking protein particle complex subunit 1 [Biomphalaria glabrata]KAK0066639.1 trafficking protein particle complex subunit 1 [Biomphalaria pfeifferi]